MVAAVATSTTGKILEDDFGQHDRTIAEILGSRLKSAPGWTQESVHVHEEVRIEPYTPNLVARNSWLPILESRIRGSVVPDNYEGESSREWLTADSANAAITFFRNGADLFPTEPHIYASKSGDLVAEFETAKGNMTTIVTDNETVLFSVLTSNPHEPIQTTIRRGSNQFRDELRAFTRKLFVG